MKVLLTHRYYVPDTPPYADILHAIAVGLSEAGHDVRVFTTKPSYKTSAGIAASGKEVLDGVTIRRISVLSENHASPLRALNALWYCLRLFIEILRVRPDTVQAATFPPIIAGWTASLAARLIGARFVYHMQDIHPEVSLYSGGGMGRGIILKLARWLDNATLRRAHRVVVLSEDMRDTILARGVAQAEKIFVINNFLPKVLPSETGIEAPILSDGALRIIFAGNIGAFQGLEAVIEAAQRTSDLPDVHYWLVGDGSAKQRLVEKAGALTDQTIFFHPFVPQAMALEMIRTAEVALVALSPQIFRVSYPSKVLTYLALGTPILAIVEEESALAQMIKKEEIGAVAPQTDALKIESAIRELWKEQSALPTWGNRAQVLYEDQLCRERALESWCLVHA